MKLGLSGYDFKHYSFKELLELLTRLDLHYLELWAYNLETEHLSVRKAADLLAAHQVQVACVNTSARYRINRAQNASEVEECQQAILHHIRLASELGAPYVNLYLGHNVHRDPYTTVRVCERLLAPCFEEADRRGVQLLTENHFDMRDEDPTGEDIVRWPERILTLLDLLHDRLQLTFDPANFYLAGVEPYPYAYELLQRRTRYIHLKDVVRYSDLLHGDRAQYAILTDSIIGSFVPVAVGQGGVNFWGFFGALAAGGFDGHLIFEPHTVPRALEEMAESSVRFTRAALDQLARRPGGLPARA